MTRERAKELLPIIQAFSEGKKVQTYTGRGWETLENIIFDGSLGDYRVKPEPREWFVVIQAHELVNVYRERSEIPNGLNGELIRVREVLE